MNTVCTIHTIGTVDGFGAVDLGAGLHAVRLATDILPPSTDTLPQTIQQGDSLLPGDTGI